MEKIIQILLLLSSVDKTMAIEICSIVVTKVSYCYYTCCNGCCNHAGVIIGDEKEVHIGVLVSLIALGVTVLTNLCLAATLWYCYICKGKKKNNVVQILQVDEAGEGNSVQTITGPDNSNHPPPYSERGAEGFNPGRRFQNGRRVSSTMIVDEAGEGNSVQTITGPDNSNHPPPYSERGAAGFNPGHRFQNGRMSSTLIGMAPQYSAD